MDNKVAILGITILILTVVFCGCFESGENPVIGTWERSDTEPPLKTHIEYNFYKEKKFLQILSVQVNETQFNHTFFGKYEITEDTLTIMYENNLPSQNEKYSYELLNTSLILSRRNVNPVQTINLTRVNTKPIRAWPNIEQPKKVSPESLVLHINDLSKDYKICHNGTDEPGRIVEPIDSFSRSFSTANCSDFEDSLLSVIIIFGSSFDASIFYHETKVPVIIYEDSKIFNSSVDAIGDNSFAHEVEILNSTQIYYWFRYANIVGLLKVPYDYSFAQTLAEIIEQKIFNSL